MRTFLILFLSVMRDKKWSIMFSSKPDISITLMLEILSRNIFAQRLANYSKRR